MKRTGENNGSNLLDGPLCRISDMDYATRLKQRLDDLPKPFPKQNKTVLITGGHGFIGSHITTWLFELGYKVLVFDRYNPEFGHDGKSRYLRYYYEHLSDKLKDKFDKRVLFLSELETKLEVHLLIHLASEVGVSNVINNKFCTADSLRLNLRVFDYVLARNIPLIFSSSSEIYGDCTTIDDETPSSIPVCSTSLRGGYAAQKLASEFMFMDLPHFTGVRFFNITGAGQEVSSGMVLPNFIEKIRKEKTIQVNKKAVRVFTNIDSVQIKDQIIGIIEESFDKIDNLFNKKIINIGLSFQHLGIEDFAGGMDNSLYYLSNIPRFIHGTIKNPKYWNNYKHHVCYQDSFYSTEINKRLLKSSPDCIYKWKWYREDQEEIFQPLNYEEYFKILICDINCYQQDIKKLCFT